MLETLVSSRIRRALLEHILSDPKERFYVRGLAKSLNVSISPLRRELKRLEHSGMLRAEEEGNMLFYAVDTNSPSFLELARMTLTIEAPSAQAPGTVPAPVPSGRSRWTSPLSTPMLVGAGGVGMTLMLIVGAILYLRITQKAPVAIVVPPATAPSSSGVMRGARWQVIPGGFGGFSSGRHEESY